MAKYRTKLNFAEAVKFTKDNIEEIKEFTDGKVKNFHIPYNVEEQASCELECDGRLIKVMENKYIVKGSDGDFYICSEDSFEFIYEEVKVLAH